MSIEGGSSAHDLFSATHGDIDDTDTPADDEVLTYDNASAKWRAEPASGHGTHIASGDDHLEAHDLFSAAHTGDVDDTDTPVNKDVLTYDGGAAKWKAESQIGSKSITIEDPTSSEDISAFFTNSAITITEIRAVLVGSSTPSVTWTVRHGTDRSAVGAEAVTGGATTTSTTTGGRRDQLQRRNHSGRQLCVAGDDGQVRHRRQASHNRFLHDRPGRSIMAGGPIFPHSAFPVTADRVFPNFHVGAGANSKHDEGLGVEASVGADSTWRLRFQMPPSLPTGTGKLRLLALANATTGVAKVNPKWVSVAVEEDPSSATLNAETTQTVTWGAGAPTSTRS